LEPQIYMWSGTREIILKRHDFFVAEVKSRVLTHFQDIEDEAEKYAESEYERLGSLWCGEHVDVADVAEAATGRGQEFYGLLLDMKVQMTLGALSTLYHQWDKDLRNFVERELNQCFVREDVVKICWGPNIGNVFDILKQFGWDIRCSAFFKRIDACRLIVNVYKHGKGHSIDKLAIEFPAYLKGPFFGVPDIPPLFKSPRYEHLSVSDDEFDEIANALRAFWVEFPERMYLNKTVTGG
jgi:hypothetical protein